MASSPSLLAENQFSLLAETMQQKYPSVTTSQMFGKPCLKVNGKAFMAQHQGTLVFKLAGDNRAKALAVPQAALWDPSGKGRPMKEWIAIPVPPIASEDSIAEPPYLLTLAEAAYHYLIS